MVDGGKASTFQIIVDNRNQASLQLADLIIDYPDGTRDPNNQTQALTHVRQSVGTIAAGQQVKSTASAIFYGQEGTQQTISVTLEYTLPGSNAIFQKQITANITIGSSPVSVNISAPSEAISDEPFGMDVTISNNSTGVIQNLVLQGQYPFGYSVSSSSPSAEVGGTLWRLGTLAQGASVTVHVQGSINGQDGDQRVFRFVAGTDADPTDTQVNTPFIIVPQTLTVRQPFISASIALNGQGGKTVPISGAQQVSGTITYQNNLTVPITDAQIVLTLVSPILDPNSVSSASGFYQSSNSTITWSKDQEPALASIAPGAQGTLQFMFSTLPPGQGGVAYINPVVDLNVSASGVRQGESGVPETVSSAASMEADVASALVITAQAFHFSGPFPNTGPMPPVAEQTTTYSVVWTVTNSSNSIANATVSASLPTYVEFVAAQPGSNITYDSGSRTVTWNIGDLNPGVGYNLPSQSAAFQVSFLPSIDQVTQSPALTSDTRLTGQDRFAQVPINMSVSGPTISLTESGGYQSEMGMVAPKQ